MTTVREWDRLAAEYQRAKAAADWHWSEIEQPADQMFAAERGPMPDLSFEIMAKDGQIAKYEVSPNKFDEFLAIPWANPHVVKLKEEWEACLRREAEIIERIDLSAVEAEGDRLLQAQCDAEERLMALPAPDGTALALKVIIALDDGRRPDAWFPLIVAEAKRIVAG